MSEVVVVAVVTAQEGKRDEVERIIAETLVPPTHAEDGCVTFALHRDTNDDRRLVFVERWASAEALGRHAKQPHMAAFREAVGPLLAEPSVIHVLDPVAMGDPARATLAGA